MGGLTTASLLAQVAHKRVLILERHFKAGGLTHSFRRDRYQWDVGLHYVGEMQPGSMTRNVMDFVTGGAVQWHPIGSPIEQYLFPEDRFDVPADPIAFQESLIDRFPEEKRAIVQYFLDVQLAKSWMSRWFVSKVYPQWLGSVLTALGGRLASMTTANYLDSRFRDPLLKSILCGQWLDYGTPPSESAFGFHALIVADYLKGGFYPVGGSAELAKAVIGIVEAFGGACLVNHRATEILVEHGKAVGVRAEHHGQCIEFRAPVVVSNASAATTFGQLVKSALAAPEREQLARVPIGTSAMVLFLGLSEDPRQHGFNAGNYWLFRTRDHAIAKRANRSGVLAESIQQLFVSFGSLRNPGQTPHVGQVICFADDETWREFAGTHWKKRGEQYENRKLLWTDAILEFVYALMPALKPIIQFKELSTPLTVTSFTGHLGGAVYGQPHDLNRLFRDRWKTYCSVPNLYLTGSDVGMCGINGAMMGGVMATARILGMFGLPRVMMRFRPRKTR